MRDRVRVVRPEAKVVNRAADVARSRILGATSGSGTSPLVGRDVTEKGDDGDGEIYTIRPMIWGLDKWGEPGSRWSKA